MSTIVRGLKTKDGEQLAEFTRRLQMLSTDGVERIYETGERPTNRISYFTYDRAARSPVLLTFFAGLSVMVAFIDEFRSFIHRSFRLLCPFEFGDRTT